MKRCPKCSTTYSADAAWCPLDGTQLQDEPELHTLTEDIDAGHTLRDMPTPMTPGTLTMGWEIPEVPTTAPGAVVPGPKAGALTMGWDVPEMPPSAPPPPAPPQPSSLTMGWEIPELPADEPPRTTPTQLAAIASPSSLFKAAALPPAAPRMTPKSLAAALARAPSPYRPEPARTPTAVTVPLGEDPEHTTGMAETQPFEQLDPEPPQRVSEPIDHTAPPFGAAASGGQAPVVDPPTYATPPIESSPALTIPPLGPPPNLAARPRSASNPPPMRRSITEPMPSVAPPPPVIEIEVVQPRPSDSIDQQPAIEHTAPVEQFSMQLRAPITMPGIVAPEIRTLRKPPSPSDAPPMAQQIAVPTELNQPSGAAIMPPAPRSSPWMWIAIMVIVIGGAVGVILALR